MTAFIVVFVLTNLVFMLSRFIRNVLAESAATEDSEVAAEMWRQFYERRDSAEREWRMAQVRAIFADDPPHLVR